MPEGPDVQALREVIARALYDWHSGPDTEDWDDPDADHDGVLDAATTLTDALSAAGYVVLDPTEVKLLAVEIKDTVYDEPGWDQVVEGLRTKLRGRTDRGGVTGGA